MQKRPRSYISVIVDSYIFGLEIATKEVMVLCRGHEGQYEVSPGKFVPKLRSVSSDLRRLSASSVVREEVTPAPLLNKKMDQGIVITHPSRQTVTVRRCRCTVVTVR